MFFGFGILLSFGSLPGPIGGNEWYTALFLRYEFVFDLLPPSWKLLNSDLIKLFVSFPKLGL